MNAAKKVRDGCLEVELWTIRREKYMLEIEILRRISSPTSFAQLAIRAEFIDRIEKHIENINKMGN